MNDVETEFEEVATAQKPRRPRKRKEESRAWIYRKVDNELKEQGNFPESVIGEPLEKRLPMFLKEFFGQGDYRAEIRNARGHFARAFDFSIATDFEETAKSVPMIENDSEEEETDFEDDSMPSDLKVFFLERELAESKRQAKEQRETLQSSQSETLSLIREMQRSSDKAFQQGREQGLEMMKMFMQFQQQPQQNPQTSILELLKETLAVQRGVRELSEEISPTEKPSGNILDGAANLIDSISRNAPKVLPLVAGLSGLKPNGVVPSTTTAQTPLPASNGNNGSGETSNLSEMFNQIKKTEKNEK